MDDEVVDGEQGQDSFSILYCWFSRTRRYCKYNLSVFFFFTVSTTENGGIIDASLHSFNIKNRLGFLKSCLKKSTHFKKRVKSRLKINLFRNKVAKLRWFYCILDDQKCLIDFLGRLSCANCAWSRLKTHNFAIQPQKMSKNIKY